MVRVTRQIGSLNRRRFVILLLCSWMVVSPVSIFLAVVVRVEANNNNNDRVRPTLTKQSASSSPFELNPNYVVSPRQHLLSTKKRAQQQHLQLQDVVDERGRLLVPPTKQQQETPAGGYYFEAQTLSFDDDDNGGGGKINSLNFNKLKQQPLSLVPFIQQHIRNMYNTNGAAITNTALSCVVVFVLWQIPSCHYWLQKYFVCSKYNLQTNIIRAVSSIVLSAISHVGLVHLGMNMIGLSSFGKQVKRMISNNASSQLSWPLWPLLLGSAISGSLYFLVLDGGRQHGGCMGLSGVTLALLAVYARFVPKRIVGTLIGGIIPLRMPAMQLVRLLILWSTVGTFAAFGRHSKIAHSTHLGGLCFGLAYYELWSRRDKLRIKVQHVKRWINNSIPSPQRK